MLDYAANAVVYWPIEALRAQFEANCAHQGLDPEQLVATLLGSDVDSERFWQQARINLQAGRVRLVFVADEIPPELRRVVEFLNGQMNPAEVLAVEIKQYVGQGLKALVPRVVGQTAQATQAKSSAATGGGARDEASFFDELTAQKGEESTAIARKLLDWAQRNLLRVRWGKGNFYVGYAGPGFEQRPYWLLSVYSKAIVYVHFADMLDRLPFSDEAKRLELLDHLNRVQGISIGADKITKYPSVRFVALRDSTALDQFLAVGDWWLRQVHQAETR